MKLALPYVGELQPADARLMELASFVGVACEAVALPSETFDYATCLQRLVPSHCSCIVINPAVMRQWAETDTVPVDLVSAVLRRFRQILVHAVSTAQFDSDLVAALSGSQLQSVQKSEDGVAYRIAADSTRVSGPFAGLSFGTANPETDRVFLPADKSSADVQTIVSVAGKPFMASARNEGAEVVFIGSTDVASPGAEVGDAPLAEYFSRFVPHAMALRYFAGDECWRPGVPHASITIDDPLLRKRYGFLNFESLLSLAEKHNFHAAIAFIPHNFRRDASHVVRLFQRHPGQLSICFHGNDHTNGEFAATDPKLLSALLENADARMAAHRSATGLTCDRVMIFPQGYFSIEAMRALQAHNFYAAVNTVDHPAKQQVRLTIGELARPAVLRYGFPLFVRRPVSHIQPQDVAFHFFFGRPVLVTAHHDTFERPEALIDLVATVNRIAPDVRWSNLADVVARSVLTRRAPHGARQVRGYANLLRIANPARGGTQYEVDWERPCEDICIEDVLANGTPSGAYQVHEKRVRLFAELPPGDSGEFALVHRNGQAHPNSLGWKWVAQAFVRRRLSEFRDNYLSKNERVLKAAKAAQRRFLRV